MFAQHPDIDIKGIGSAAPLVHVSNHGGSESARCAISVLGIGQSGGGTIAKVPEEAIATPSIDKRYVVRCAPYFGSDTFRHRKIVVDIESKEGVVAVIGTEIVWPPHTIGDWEIVVSRTTGANALV